MYREFFGLKEKPFNVTSDPGFIFFSETHREAFSHILYGIKERKGFLEITGEIGAGKTTLCKAILNQLGPTTKSAYIFNSNLPPNELMQTILEDFGITVTQKSKSAMLRQLNNFLLEELIKGNNAILIIDEAQNLSHAALEDIRMLSNLETESEKLFQIILVGQPELKDKIDSPRLKQLRSRIAVRYHLPALRKDDIEKYINHRLAVAGSKGSITFTDEAIEFICSFSGGIPRKINMICDKALLAAFVFEEKEIGLAIVHKSAKELEGIAK